MAVPQLRMELQTIEDRFARYLELPRSEELRPVLAPLLVSIERDFERKEQQLLGALACVPGFENELARRQSFAGAPLRDRLARGSDNFFFAAPASAVEEAETAWARVMHVSTLLDEAPPPAFEARFHDAIGALRYNDGSYKSVRKHVKRVNQVQMTFDKALRRIGNVASPRVGAALVIGAMLDKRVRCTKSTHRWFLWIKKQENFEAWFKEVQSAHERDLTEVAHALAVKHMKDTRGRPPKAAA